MSAKKTTAAKAAPATDASMSAEAKRWAGAVFTDDELRVIYASMRKEPPLAKLPRAFHEVVAGEALKRGVALSEAKDILRKAMTPAGGSKATRAPVSPERKPAGGGKPGGGKSPVRPSTPPREAPKKARVASTGGSRLDVIRNAISAKGGASLTTLMNLTGWQAHSVRGAIATMRTKDGASITSEKRGTDRMYELGAGKAEPKQAAAAAAAKRAPRKVIKKPTAKRAR